MNDTHPAMAQKWQEIMASKSPEERFLMGLSMYDTAKELVISSIRERDPAISSPQLRRGVFLRFYASDFEPRTRDKILAWFDSAPTFL